jgi:hypothetical protein
MINLVRLPQNRLYYELAAELEDRSSNWERISLEDYASTLPSRSDILASPPSLATSLAFQDHTNIHRDHYVILGSYSFTDMTMRAKVVSQVPYTFGEVASQYVRHCMAQQKVNPPKDFSRRHEGHGPPIYFRGYMRGELSYVDIEACFFQLYRYLSLDGRYFQGSWSGGTFYLTDTDQFGVMKPVRNILFGLMAGGETTIHTKKHKIATRHVPTFTSHPAVGEYVWDTTKAVALDAMRKFPSIGVWLTDAAILPTRDVESFRDFLASEWALRGVVKASSLDGELYNVTSHKIGTKRTRDIVNGRVPTPAFPYRPIVFDDRRINIDILKKTRQRVRGEYANRTYVE